MEMVALKPWGNSQGIRIPKSILQQLNIESSDLMQISVEDEAIVLRKVYRHKSFEERLSAYGDEITVSDFDWDDTGEIKKK